MCYSSYSLYRHSKEGECVMTNGNLFKQFDNIAPKYQKNANIVLFHGDAIQLLKDIPNNSVNLVLTSPPYNLGKDYETKVSIEYYLKEQEQLIENLYAKLSPKGSICWQVGNFVENGEVFPLDIYYYPIFKKLGMKLRNRIVWHFGHGLHASKRFSGRYETLLWFSKSDNYTFNLDNVRVPSKYPGKRYYKGPNAGKPSGNPNGKNPSDIWELMLQEWEEGLWDIPNVKSNHPEKTIHPCQFPVELVQRCVLALTNEGDIVFDPFSGVGSTVIGAITHDRRAIASERDGAYVEIARQRINSYYQGTLKIRPLGKPVHEPTGQEKVAQTPEEWASLSQNKLLEKGS
jgi:adenine-specific DNA-methyltransferase